MGSIVKSIGKAIKKIGKGLKKVIKKIWPILLVAAAVYVGVAFYGASLSAGTAAAGGSTLGTTNFMTGLKAMGSSAMKFFSPTAGTAPGVSAASQYATGATTGVSGAAGIVPTLGETAAAQYAGGNVLGEFAMQTAITPGSATAFMGDAALTNALKENIIKSYSSAVAGGMTSGDALVYMTKMNMLATGAKMVAGFFDKSEEEQRQHEKEILSQRYAYGRPMTDEQKAFKAENPDWIAEHPAMQQQDLYSSPNLMQSEAMASLPTQATVPSPYVQQQTIGQPTLGRQSTRQYGTSAPTAFAGTTPGLIKQGTQGVFNPTKQRYA